MADIALHVRIFEPEPSDEFVEKRTAAIKDLSARFTKRKAPADVLQLANDASLAISGQAMAQALASEVEAAIKKQSTAFVQNGQELQMSVCVLLALQQNLDGATPGRGPLTVAELLAASLWSALSFQTPRKEPKLEALRSEVLAKCREVVSELSTASRRRAEVPDIAFKTPEEMKAAISKTTDALRANAALDREELDLLWWVLGDWSTLLDVKLSATASPAAAISAGIEGARLLRRLPAHAHKHLVARNVAKIDPLSLNELAQAVADTKARLLAPFQENPILQNCPAVFPLLTAIAEGKASSPSSKSKQPMHDWIARALLEASVLHIAASPNATV